MLSKTVLFCVLLALGNAHVKTENDDPPTLQQFTLGSFRAENPEYYYLPKTMIPMTYGIRLEPLFESNTFNGNVTIVGYNPQAINQIIMHSLDIAIKKLSVNVDGDVVGSTYSFLEDREFLVIDIESVPANSQIAVKIFYTGNMEGRIRGLYIATYQDELGNEKRMATTHLEPTHARRMYPCFDEPALKANITLEVVRPRHYNSKTNMPLYQTKFLDKQRAVDYYITSPLMSTYLVAVVVSEFHTIFAVYPDQTRHEVHGDLSDLKKSYGDLALLTSRQVISALEEYTGVKFPLEKIGQVAIPKGFFGGAMENWGLVVYGEDSFLFKPKICTEINRNGVVNIIAHEYAHQWFGNLVGPASWAYTWLNEGFATYFTRRVPQMIYPNWRFDEQFAWGIPAAMVVDGAKNTRPMTIPVGHPGNIMATFDAIAYEKSSCIIRMFEHILGRSTFKDALNIYLKKRQYKGATADDLTSSFVQALQNSNNGELAEKIVPIFNSWHLQKGFPLVTVTRNYENNTMTLSQRRFINDGSESDEIYRIPINFFLETSTTEEKADTRPAFWLDEKELVVDLPPEAKDSFIILNKHYTGYFRVQYDKDNYDRIRKSTATFRDMPKNRVQLLEDSFTFMSMKLLAPEIARNLFFSIIENDTNYLVIKSSMKYVDSYIKKYHAQEEKLDELLRHYNPILESYANLDRDGDYIDTVVRNNLIVRLCRINSIVCLGKMDYYMRKKFVLESPNVQENAVCGGMMNPKDAEWKFNMVMDIILNENESEIRDRFVRALTCTKDVHLGKKILDWITYPETNPLNISNKIILQNYCRDYDNADRALEYFKENFATLKTSYSLDDLNSLLFTIGLKLNTDEHVKTIDVFLESTVLTVDERAIFERTRKLISSNIQVTQDIPL